MAIFLDGFTPGRGLHQGCCISPHLFNCCGQVFADLLSNNTNIKGIVAQGIRNLLAQFADDTSLFLHADEQNMKHVSDTLTYAYRNLGLKVNAEKTVIYRIGTIRGSNAKYYTQAAYAWDDPPIKTLGIEITTDVMDLTQINMIPVLKSIRETLHCWQQRQLTLTGRVLVINTLVESKLVYRLSILPFLDNKWVEEFQQCIISYVWQGKRPKINFGTLTAPKSQGGLRLCDVNAKHKALLCQWIFVLEPNTFLWLAMKSALKPYSEHMSLIWCFNLKVKHIEKELSPSIWRSIFIAWGSFHFFQPNTYDQIIRQIIWYNSNILVDNKPYFNRNLSSKGLKTIEDMLNDQGEIMTPQEIEQKYPGEIWLEYVRLYKAIPKRWSHTLNTETTTGNYVYPYEKLKKQKKPIAGIYRELTSKPSIYLDALNRWRRVPFFICSDKLFHDAFSATSGLTISTKLRDFQYRLLHKKVPSNKELFHWKIRRTPKCDRCTDDDSIDHLLFNCQCIQKLWDQFAFFITNTFSGEAFVINIV